ncbi:MAG: hypothetical protein H7Y00_14535 [Fimbriimonadaceae bacterium]|nr:hypothetical protein [Chitinophagales bacterium]
MCCKKIHLLLYFAFNLSLLLNAQNNFLKGGITDSVICKPHSENNYAVFLPSVYSEENAYPVIFIHDPGARGKLATEVFAHAAEKYKYILACSNVIQNGTDGNKLMAASQIMQQDVQQKFSIDTSRIYLCGFSGGSRLSTAIALQQKNFKGVIAVGAGLPYATLDRKKLNDNIIYACAFGTTDMNYLEMLDLTEMLRRQSVTVRTFEFNGGHEWCDSSTAMHIFEWLQFQEMKKGTLKKDQSFIDSILNVYNKHLEDKLLEKDFFHSLILYNDLLSDALNISSTSFIGKDIQNNLQSNEALKQIQTVQNIIDNEEQERNNYLLYIYNRLPGIIIYDSTLLKNDVWWKQTSKKLKKAIEEKKNTYEAESAARLYDILLRTCWEQGDVYFSQNNFTAAKEMYQLNTLVDSENKYAWLGLAKAEALLQHEKAALVALDKAVECGLKNKTYLQNETAFNSLRDSKKFKQLLAEIE